MASSPGLHFPALSHSALVMAWTDLVWPYTVLGLLAREATICFEADSPGTASIYGDKRLLGTEHGTHRKNSLKHKFTGLLILGSAMALSQHDHEKPNRLPNGELNGSKYYKCGRIVKMPPEEPSDDKKNSAKILKFSFFTPFSSVYRMSAIVEQASQYLPGQNLLLH